MFFAPTLLCRQFQKPQFYKHFLCLVRLLKLCMEFELTQEQIDELKEGFKSWVKDYERYVLEQHQNQQAQWHTQQ